MNPHPATDRRKVLCVGRIAARSREGNRKVYLRPGPVVTVFCLAILATPLVSAERRSHRRLGANKIRDTETLRAIQPSRDTEARAQTNEHVAECKQDAQSVAVEADGLWGICPQCMFKKERKTRMLDAMTRRHAGRIEAWDPEYNSSEYKADALEVLKLQFRDTTDWDAVREACTMCSGTGRCSGLNPNQIAEVIAAANANPATSDTESSSMDEEVCYLIVYNQNDWPTREELAPTESDSDSAEQHPRSRPTKYSFIEHEELVHFLRYQIFSQRQNEGHPAHQHQRVNLKTFKELQSVWICQMDFDDINVEQLKQNRMNLATFMKVLLENVKQQPYQAFGGNSFQDDSDLYCHFSRMQETWEAFQDPSRANPAAYILWERNIHDPDGTYGATELKTRLTEDDLMSMIERARPQGENGGENALDIEVRVTLLIEYMLEKLYRDANSIYFRTLRNGRQSAFDNTLIQAVHNRCHRCGGRGMIPSPALLSAIQSDVEVPDPVAELIMVYSHPCDVCEGTGDYRETLLLDLVMEESGLKAELDAALTILPMRRYT